YSLADDFFSALQTTDLPKTESNSDALTSVLSVSRRSNSGSGSDQAALISELKSCYNTNGSGIGKDQCQWLLGSLPNGSPTFKTGEAFDQKQKPRSLLSNRLDNELSFSATGRNADYIQSASILDQKVQPTQQSQRIRHLREQLKVWVKTPARDELPVFEITGMPEKLGEAKRIILQMSEHFSKVQQERLSRIEPNRTEDRLYVEQDKVGLIVGASGQTIRWVQQLSDTHIATPRKQESIPGLPSPQMHFTICGTRERVRFAKQLICEYVSLRCQGLWLDPELEPSPEAARLVHEFHARRQAEDTQRRGSAPASVTIAAALSRQTADEGAAAAASADAQSLAELKRLWQEGGPPPAVWDGVLFGGLPPTSVPPPPMQLMADRRYSVDAHSVAQHHRQQQQQKQQPQSEQRQFLFGLDLDGLDLLPKSKSHSEDPVLPADGGVNGWM
uniref:KH domain-containing protein n=1 Tax=Macrostomum lignano TaxID=282301 RepID=A0A1I8GZF3_9PLAT